MSIVWSNVDINRFATLKKECDDALSLLNEVDEDQKGAVSHSIQDMVNELESFCIKYGDDERIVLFYKQKFRLRMAIQNVATMGLNTTATSGNHDSTITSPRDRSSSPQRTGVSFINDTGDKDSPRFVDYNTTANSSMNIRLNTSDSPSRKSSQKPIYAWELDDVTPVRQRIRLEGAQYYPSSTPGVYMREDPLAKEVVHEDKFIDIQIVLTEEEFTTLVSRRRAISRTHYEDYKNKIATKSVNNAVPFVDRSRISNTTMSR